MRCTVERPSPEDSASGFVVKRLEDLSLGLLVHPDSTETTGFGSPDGVMG
jgi:hypothetical protein